MNEKEENLSKPTETLKMLQEYQALFFGSKVADLCWTAKDEETFDL